MAAHQGVTAGRVHTNVTAPPRAPALGEEVVVREVEGGRGRGGEGREGEREREGDSYIDGSESESRKIVFQGKKYFKSLISQFHVDIYKDI